MVFLFYEDLAPCEFFMLLANGFIFDYGLYIKVTLKGFIKRNLFSYVSRLSGTT